MQKMKILKPTYYNAFKCIASACEDNCCMGWAVDIDQKTYQKYLKLSDPKMKKLVQKVLKRNEYCDAKEINYAYVKLTKSQNCSFLDEDKLCMLQGQYGEAYLSNVCTLYPRIYNQINGVMELSLSASCPEALRHFLFDPKGIVFENQSSEQEYPIITYNVNQNEGYFSQTPVAYLSQTRQVIMEILGRDFKNDGRSFRASLFDIGNFINDMKDQSSHKPKKAMHLLIQNWTSQVLKNDFLAYHNETLRLTQKIFETLDAENQIFSKRYKSLHSEAVTFHKANSSKAVLQDAITGFDVFITSDRQIFFNYFSNLIFRNIFPYTEADDIFDAYMLLITRFMMIQFDLIGLIGSRGKLSEGVLIEYFQSFSKAIEHHQNFFADMTEYFRMSRQNNWQLVRKL